MLKETCRRGYRDVRRRNESTAESVLSSEVGPCNKKSRTFSNSEMVALTSRNENAPPPLNSPDPTRYCLPQAKSTEKNFEPSALLNSWRYDAKETHIAETCLIDFDSTKEAAKESSTDFVIGFIDEEEMFNMPGLVDSMAEGMLLTPPAMKRGFKWSHDFDDQVDDTNYIDLWGE
ncbi:dehydration-responsive element-binding protein 1D-like [Dorcoceras hygrometricum]|uniref:Dehydration-responsive element-binding protein 1D-like n=1 Tax=Dorcoceras hygrometricum TaxID=472368 RepID=A0A2Z7C764_9LAMI|nr:dehydration-responsive element-binding protein 1D-like [Dorcoceras hygrometricum]